MYISNGTVEDLDTGEIYKLGGVTVLKGTFITDGTGLVLKVDNGKASIHRVTKISEPGKLSKIEVSLEKQLTSYEINLVEENN